MARKRLLTRCAALLATCLGASPATHALDLSAASPPVEIPDRQVSVGERTLRLPEGDWWELDHYTWQATAGRAVGRVDSAFIARIEHGTIGLAGRIVLLKDDIPANSWTDQPCGGVGDIYVKEYAKTRNASDCLVVRSMRVKDMAELLKRTFPNAVQWVEGRHMTLPDAAVRIRYARYSSNTYGIVDLFVPAEYFDSEQSAIAWAESLRSSLKALFEHRENGGELPALSLPAEIPEASSPAESAAKD